MDSEYHLLAAEESSADAIPDGPDIWGELIATVMLAPPCLPFESSPSVC